MRKLGIITTLSFILFILLVSVSPVVAGTAEVRPAEIAPGDAFVVKVAGPSIEAAPKAEMSGNSLDFTSCGTHCFEAIGALGLNTAPGRYPIEVKVGKAVMTVYVNVKPAVFPTVNLTLPEREVILNPEDLARAQKEEELLESIWKKETPRLWAGKFVLPLPTEISTAFGLRRVLNKERISIHKGIDMRGHEGERIEASNRGRVVLARNLFFGGNTVVIDHGMGIYSIYMHLSKFDVSPGEIVLKGQTVGLVGSTGRATGPHLHFSMKLHEISANPVSFTRLPL